MEDAIGFERRMDPVLRKTQLLRSDVIECPDIDLSKREYSDNWSSPFIIMSIYFFFREGKDIGLISSK